MRSRGDVGGIVRITWELFRQQEYVLVVVGHLLLTMRKVERNQVGQRVHIGVRERREVVRDLRSKFIQQRSELVIGVSEYVPRINVNDSRTEAFHHAQRIFRKRDGQLVALNAAAVVAIIEKAHIASDPRAVERAGLEKLRVLAGQLVSDHFTKRRLQRAQQNRNVGDAAAHRSRRVLLVSDRNDSVLRYKTESRLQTDDVLNGRRSCD